MATAVSPIELNFTGERVVPGAVEPDLWNEHVSRYHFAASLAAEKTVLDVGCGSGYGTELLAASARTAIACDISPEAVQYAALKTSEGKFLVASASALPLPSECIDLVVAFEVIEHIPEWEELILESARVLSDQGVFFVSTPNKLYYAETREGVGVNPFHEHEFELEEFRDALGRAFPFVQIFGQNHQESVVFSSGRRSGDGHAFVPESNDLPNSHFFVAVCSKQSLAIPSFAYIPSTANLLREREHYIQSLQSELEEVRTDRANLLTAHRQLNCELEHQNEWARRLDRELVEKNSDALRQAAEIGIISVELEKLQSQAAELKHALESVRHSFWLRLGRMLDIGPWTEGRLHLKRIGRRIQSSPLTRYFVGPWSLAFHVLKSCMAFAVLAATALIFAFEDLCFFWFGKQRLGKESRVSQVAASVIITNWNGRLLLESYLPSVIAALSPNKRNEILVVDNASSDGSVEFLRTNFPSVRVLELDRNLGFGAGSNVGVKAAINDVVVLLNNDMRVDANFLTPLLQPFGDPLVFAVSSQIFFSDPTKRREETGLTEVWWDHGILKASHRIDPTLKAAYPCAYPGGGSSAFDRRKFLELGGFDELFEPFYYEDTDLGFRAWKRGWKVLYQPASVVHHCHRATIRKSFSENVIQAVIRKNAILYCWKNIHSWKSLCQHFCVTFWDSCRRTGRTADQCSANDVFRSFRQITTAIQSRWFALSTAKLSDTEAFNQPLGGYYRDTFIAPFSPPPSRLSILFASPYPIEPPVHGGGVFMKQTLSHLAKAADVHLVSFLDNEYQLTDQQSLNRLCRSAHFLVRGSVPKSSFTLTPFPVRQFASRDFSWMIHRTMLLEQIDVVQLEYTMLGQYAGDYRHIPCFLFEHDIFSQTLRRALKRTDLTAEVLSEYFRMRLYEPRLLNQVTRVQVCSSTNAKYLNKLAPKVRKIDSDMRAAIDTRQYSGAIEPRDLNTLLFVGSFNHSPNVQALRWFISNVFHHILAVRPDVVLEIVGSNPPTSPNVWTDHPNIRLVGAVPDVRLPLQRAGIFICPILRGSGIRVKLLEAFASRIPVVSTTVGAEGLTSESGVICELANTPEAFAKSVLMLLENETYRNELVERAWLVVARERDSCQACARLQDSYREEVSQIRPVAIARSASA